MTMQANEELKAFLKDLERRNEKLLQQVVALKKKIKAVPLK